MVVLYETKVGGEYYSYLAMSISNIRFQQVFFVEDAVSCIIMVINEFDSK